MKKIFTLIALICFSQLAYADQWEYATLMHDIETDDNTHIFVLYSPETAERADLKKYKAIGFASGESKGMIGAVNELAEQMGWITKDQSKASFIQDITQILNYMGNDGWELATRTIKERSGHQSDYFILKRKK